MIRTIESDLKSFKTINFLPGLNILLAQKSPNATKLQTRNGAGKTSLLELVHFLFGARSTPKSIFRKPELKNCKFSMAFELNGENMVVSRVGSTNQKILLKGNTQNWPIVPQTNPPKGEVEISNEDWKKVLGHFLFKLKFETDADQDFTPTFRSLFPYFARRIKDGAFQKPTKFFNQQQTWNEQVAISYLLDLDWNIATDFQKLKVEIKDTRDLKSIGARGSTAYKIGKPAEIRSQIAVKTHDLQQIKSNFDSFKIVNEYRELEKEADELTGKIALLGEENLIDRRSISENENSLIEETEPGEMDLETLYSEAGILIPELINLRIKTAKEFHRKIISNRKNHLEKEISSAKNRIKKREKEKTRLDQRRSTIMDILKTGGALDQYLKLQEELGRLEGDIQTLQRELEVAQELKERETQHKIDMNELEKKLSQDINERSQIVHKAIWTFEELSKSLYERAGQLIIDSGEKGPKFDVKIEGQSSEGIAKMQIFCFDHMLMDLNSQMDRSTGFLIHDSHLFDGVDGRQVAKVLQIGAQRAEEKKFQYIVTLNSDALPIDEFPPDFDIQKYILDVELTDKTETGGLFGLRFD